MSYSRRDHGLQSALSAIENLLRPLLLLQSAPERVRRLEDVALISIMSIIPVARLNFTARTAAGGLDNGLSLILRYKDDNYDALQSYSHGFKLLIQETDAFPSAHATCKFLGLGSESFATIRVEETFCSAAVKALPVEQRNCIFRHEFQLRYFSEYVYPNCELNCRVGNMVRLCGCHTYFFDFNRTRDRICSFRDIPCLVDNFRKLKHGTRCYT